MKLSALFTDHAVFQRNLSIPVWGWTTPSTQVKAIFNNVTIQTLSSLSGKFELRFPPMTAGGPYELKVSNLDGSDQVTVKNILIGEVWLASGQSNMEWMLEKTMSYRSFPKERFNRANIRFIHIPHTAYAGKIEDFEAKWTVCNFASAADCSAVAFYFAEKLYAELDIPIGLVNSSWGGTRIEAWTGREMLMQNPAMAAEIQQYESMSQSPKHWKNLPETGWENPMACLDRKNDECFTQDPGIIDPLCSTPDFDDSAWKTISLPRTWQSVGNTFSGSFWFRKEIEIDPAWDGKELLLCLGAADKHDMTFFNGVEIGATGTGLEQQHWNVPREYTVPGKLVKPGTNIIASRVFSFFADGGLIGPTKTMKVCLKNAPENNPIVISGEWKYKCEHNIGTTTPNPLPFGPGNQHSPAILYDNMIHPLLPYALKGAIWYQGESNAGKHYLYARQLQDMVKCWRYAWGQGDFPFYTVQLANFRGEENYQEDSTWAPLREAQSRIVEIPNTGVATIIDIGEEADIHPQNKHDVGARLAQLALHNDYHQLVVPCGPTYSRMAIEGSAIRLFFDNIGGGLMTKNGESKTFVIAGFDNKFKEATAIIENDTILVSNPEIHNPIAVRYAWADNPEGANLYNKEGFPASPFRTDGFFLN